MTLISIRLNHGIVAQMSSNHITHGTSSCRYDTARKWQEAHGEGDLRVDTLGVKTVCFVYWKMPEKSLLEVTRSQICGPKFVGQVG